MFQPIENNYLAISSKREANWFFYFLMWQGLVPPNKLVNSISERAKCVLEILNQESICGQQTNFFIDAMRCVFSKQLERDHNDLRWIQQNDSRLINWLYEQIPRLISTNADLYFISDCRESEAHLHMPVERCEHYVYILDSGRTVEEKYEAIIFALDVNPATLYQKHYSLERLQQEWYRVLRSSRKLGWLTKCEVEPQRAWKNLITISERFDDPILVCPLRLNIIQPGHYKQIAETIQTVIDCYHSDCIRIALKKSDITVRAYETSILQQADLEENNNASSEAQNQHSDDHNKKQHEIRQKYITEYLAKAAKLLKRMRQSHDVRMSDDRKRALRKAAAEPDRD